MNKIYIIFCFLLVSLSVSAQQFTQYNTGTLYDSFENPSVRSFIPDSSRQYAFNFFIPNFGANASITGDIQQALKNRLFSKYPSYKSTDLKIGKFKYNHLNANVNAYGIMLKTFTSLNGDVEMGFSYQTKAEARGLVSDETLALFDNVANFKGNPYDGIFNNNFQMQTYNQISYSYRERINKQLAFGFKLSALLGVKYSKFNIASSHAVFDSVKSQATIALRGRYYSSYIPGQPSAHDYLPSFRNPGASITFGTSYLTDDKITIQANVKDLGFIHWSNRSIISNFNNSTTIGGLDSKFREDSIYNSVISLLRSGPPANEHTQSFTTKTNAKAELSASKTYWIDYDSNFKYSPTLVASKELWYNGFTAALVNHVQYENYTFSLSGTYDELNLFNVGAQLMYKTPNIEIFGGSERLLNTGRLAFAALGNQTQIDHVGSYTGMDLFIGFSLKFGAVIEHPMNASFIPMGEKGFFGRLWGRLFKTDK
ncbi:DUF5723 family protein [Mucilaginibacter sp. FT3.2]|uniref:DUF5723 family protein n=1 Tax=Mucilaginibacter sp. FT3.2 TaxID=2723090 RepID=UPI001619F2F1|nr:DUF5723 family protein [Mucilaginibacter sp. FT3.2]MBB6230241.1 hypothetical protein [Mucilaginibacter sp. FT3.2]